MRYRPPSPATIKLLTLLLEQPDAQRYGYELMKSSGLNSGTMYPILMRLHERGFLDAAWRPPASEGRPPRHAYRLTDAGRAYAIEHENAKLTRTPSKRERTAQ